MADGQMLQIVESEKPSVIDQFCPTELNDA